MKQDEILLSEVNTAEYNPRVISDKDLESLKESLKKFGCLRPLLINKETNILISGHQTLKAAQEIGFRKLPYIILDLNEKDEKKLNLALNKIQGDWDYDKLNKILSSFIDLKHTGFYDYEVQFFKDIHSYQDLDKLDFNFDISPKIKMERIKLSFNVSSNDYEMLHSYFGGKK